MSRMPGAAWVPLPHFSTTRMRAHNVVCIHTMVGSLMGTDDYFRRITTGVNSHYGTGGVGEPIRQWGDTAFRSGANLDGNGDVISIEDADMGPGFPAWDTGDPSNVPPFTDLQCEDIAQILAWESSPAAHATCPTSWACHRDGIPLELIPDTLPGRRGVGYHRQGVDPYRAPGGVKWSSSYGKVCPTDRRYEQIPQIIARAKQIRAGTPTPLPVLEDDMRLLRVADTGRIYTATDLEVTYVADPAVAAAAAKAWGEPKDVTQREVDLLSFDANARRARARVELAQAAGGDIDEAAIVAGLLPQITAALDGKGGASKEEIAELLRGITLRAS